MTTGYCLDFQVVFSTENQDFASLTTSEIKLTGSKTFPDKDKQKEKLESSYILFN